MPLTQRDNELSQSLKPHVTRPGSPATATNGNLQMLTQREREILAWIAEGKSDWQIGQILNISSKTVNYHVENAKRKFAVATRIQAVIAALRQDLLAR
jgi:DNA-binding CsgD family transcriptional regulator